MTTLQTGTARIVQNFSANHKSINLIERPKKLGLGSAYRDGFKWALEQGYKHCIEMDGDFSHTIVDLQNLIKFKDEFDLVIGSRYIKGVKLKDGVMVENYSLLLPIKLQRFYLVQKSMI